jgi:hypothetical protein
MVASPRAESREARCQSLAHAAAAVAKEPDTVAHAYPITPYHADYLGHVDRVPKPTRQRGPRRGRDRHRGGAGRRGPAQGRRWRRHLAGPTAAKEGWFQAYHLLRSAVVDRDRGARADRLNERLLLGSSRTRPSG